MSKLHVRIATRGPATVLSQLPLSPLEGGNAVRFCLGVFFVCGSASAVFFFFAVLLFLGSLFRIATR